MCSNPNYPPAGNTAKGMAAAVLTFAILSLVSFFSSGIIAGVGAVLAIIASSLVVCCARQQPGPGAGCTFKAAAILSLIAAIVHLVGAILMIVVYINFHEVTSDAVDQVCVENQCDNGAWINSECDDYGNLCTSEEQCSTAQCSSCAVTVCSSAIILSMWQQIFAIIVWPGIALSIICFLLELTFTILAFKAAGPMEQSKGTMVIDNGNYGATTEFSRSA